MAEPFASPQDTEDAFYDALQARDLEALMGAWEDSEEIACLLPMRPLVQGRTALRQVWQRVLGSAQGVAIEVHHRCWLDAGAIAVHCVEERVSLAGLSQPIPPMYATNIYRRGPDGWLLIFHQNSPAPPPGPGSATNPL